MELRDEFAAAALKGLLANSGGPVQSSPMCGWTYCNCQPEDIAREAYTLADAMMQARTEVAPVGDQVKVEDLTLSVRTKNCLLAENIFFVRELVELTHTDLLKIPRMGRRSREEVVTALEERGLHLRSRA